MEVKSIDDLFRREILEDLEEDTFLDDENSLVEAVMSESELALLDEAEQTILEDDELDDFLNDDEEDILDDMIDLEDDIHE